MSVETYKLIQHDYLPADQPKNQTRVCCIEETEDPTQISRPLRRDSHGPPTWDVNKPLFPSVASVGAFSSSEDSEDGSLITENASTTLHPGTVS